MERAAGRIAAVRPRLARRTFVHFCRITTRWPIRRAALRTHLLTSRAAIGADALLLLGPQTPMLFMGQEFAASSPFLYFADHEPELACCEYWPACSS